MLRVTNKLIAAILGIGTAVCTAAVDYAYTEQINSERIEVNIMNPDKEEPHNIYCGFTAEELGSGYDKPASVLGKVILNVPIIDQFPELPVGCEVTSATAVLQYLGFEVDKLTLTNNYLKWDDNFTYDSNMVSHGPDPKRVFAGDPHKWGYGCYAPVIIDTLNKFFADKGADYKALPIEDLNSADIELIIDEGVPMIVWASRGMKQFKYNDPPQWIINGTNKTFTWLSNSHTLVLCGYDSDNFYFMDCDGKDKITPYPKEIFLKRFNENGSQCVVVKDYSSYVQ